MDIHARLSAIAAGASADQTQAYRALTDELVANQHADLAQTLLDHLIDGGGVQMLVARPALAYLCEEVKGFTSQPDLKSFCMYALERLKRNTSFAQSDQSLKMNLAECYLQEDCFAEAAETLARIDLSQGRQERAFRGQHQRDAELFRMSLSTTAARRTCL